MITMVKESSQVSTRTNYRVFCETGKRTMDFYVFYFYKSDSVKVVGVNVTKVGGSGEVFDQAQGSQRLLAIAASSSSSASVSAKYLAGLVSMLTSGKATNSASSTTSSAKPANTANTVIVTNSAVTTKNAYNTKNATNSASTTNGANIILTPTGIKAK